MNSVIRKEKRSLTGIGKTACFLLALTGVQLLSATAGVASEQKFTGALSGQLQDMLDSAVTGSEGKFSAAIFRVETPKGNWVGTSGVSNINSNSALVPEAKFRAASVLKPFVAAVILQLVEEGELTLDDRLTTLLPAEITSLFDHSDTITLKMLLNHTSGIGEWTEGFEPIFLSSPLGKVWKETEFVELGARNGTKAAPGETYAYNNTGYTLLGMIIEQVTGNSWRENIRQRIFAKVALNDTSLPEPGDSAMSAPYLSGYEVFDGVFTDTTNIDPSMGTAAGGHGLVTTVEDLAVLIKALMAGHFFEKPETLSTMLEGVASGPGRQYGLGIGQVTMPDGSYGYGHTGGTAGYSNFLYHIPERGVTIATVINSDQEGAILGYLLPSLKIIFGYLESDS